MSKQPLVLVAEDDPDMRAVIAEALSAEGIGVEEVHDGFALVDRLRDRAGPPLDLVISDVRMPGWTGLEVLALGTWLQCEAPMIIITAFGDAETHGAAENLGAAAVLDKPLDVDALIELAKDILENAVAIRDSAPDRDIRAP